MTGVVLSRCLRGLFLAAEKYAEQGDQIQPSSDPLLYAGCAADSQRHDIQGHPGGREESTQHRVRIRMVVWNLSSWSAPRFRGHAVAPEVATVFSKRETRNDRRAIRETRRW